ncbi:hypothetical protein GCM10010431_65060 [Streptomyces kunmingensis]
MTMTDKQTSPAVTVTLAAGPTGGSIDDFELFYARRALDRFRTLLGRQGLLDLLAADIEEGNAFLRECARTSDGEFHAGTTVLEARGMSSAEFLDWMDGAFKSDDERPLLAAHPEHYVMGADDIGARGGEHRPPRLLVLHGWLGHGRDGLGRRRGRAPSGGGVSAQDVLEPLPGGRHRRRAGADPVR